MKKLFRHNLDALFIGMIMFFVFAYIMFYCHSDLRAHAEISVAMLTEGRLFCGNFLMYLIVNVLSCFSEGEIASRLALVFMLSVSIVAKYIIVRQSFYGQHFDGLNTGVKLSKLISASLVFVYIIPILVFLKIFGYYSSMHNMYLGYYDPDGWTCLYYVPNVWHNSTIIFMMPFAIMVYLLSVKQLNEYDEKRNGWIAFYTIVSVLIKPSFFFVYAVAYPIVLFVKYRFRKVFFYSMLPVLCGIVCVLFEYLTIYLTGASGNAVVIDFSSLFTLEYWRHNILFIISSYAFPALFICAYRKEVVHDLEFWFVLIMLIVANGIWWGCHEVGSRANDGNFYWQIVPSLWLVFYYILKIILKCSPKQLCEGLTMKEFIRRGTMRTNCFLSLYCLHVIMGVAYLVKFIVSKTFW